MKRATAIVLALVLAVSLFTACSSGSSSASSGAQYKAGTYTATVDGRNGPLTMEGVFTEDAIESLTVTSHSETEGISDGAIQDLPQQIVDAQSLQVDAVAGATITSEAVIAAVKDLVEQAGGDVQALENAGTAEYSKAMTAGTYTATARGHHSDVTVEVTVSDEAIESVTVVDDDETYNISDAAIDTVPGQIVEHQSVNVDGVAGATMTSQAILNAVRDCIEQAGGQEAVNAFSVRAGETPSTEEFTMEADVVVAGSGLTGIAAALAAQQEGASVILIEKLPFVGGISPITVVCGVTKTSYDREHMEVVGSRLRDFIGDIADQIEREQEALVRETEDVSGRDADAFAWVEERGGIEHVRQQWGHLRGRANHADHVDRQLAKRQRQIDESHAALRRRNERIAELKAKVRVRERANDELNKELTAMRPRLMPEGMEWLVEAWPRFEDDAPVRFGEEAMGFTYKPPFVVDLVTLFDGCEATVCA